MVHLTLNLIDASRNTRSCKCKSLEKLWKNVVIICSWEQNYRSISHDVLKTNRYSNFSHLEIKNHHFMEKIIKLLLWYQDLNITLWRKDTVFICWISAITVCLQYEFYTVKLWSLEVMGIILTSPNHQKCELNFITIDPCL